MLIASKHIRELLSHYFPYPTHDQKLNKHIKQVCELAGLTEPMNGKLLDLETNRKLSGVYPKHQLITSHCFRRSFATNYYKKIPTPVLMTITGHSKESIFLRYINKQENKDDNAKIFLKYFEAMEK